MTLMLNGTKHIPALAVAQRTSIRYTEPAPTEKLNWLIHLQHVRGDTETCKELIKKEIVNSEGRNEFLFFKQGSILKEEGKVAEALESFQICLKLNPENTENIKEVGACLYYLGRYKLALDAYKEAERVTKLPDWQVFHRIAETNLILEDIEQAKHYIRQAIQYGKNESSYALLVKLLKKQADYKAALAACKSSIE
ncbi:hypothetical protein WA026_007901 [Henosepilachna vigintioctopunctata]|uniref:Tetratricopeptide repeat protein n=1 Tax=Henosepilachna vigintioctopunctata TaxID=420089 RepID=A0AAW1U5I1_9CUCU